MAPLPDTKIDDDAQKVPFKTSNSDNDQADIQRNSTSKNTSSISLGKQTSRNVSAI